MNCKTTPRKAKALGLVTVLWLLVPAAAQATSDSAAMPTATQGGLGWSHAAIGLAIVLGVAVIGLWGDVAVRIVLAGVDALVAAISLAMRRSQDDDIEVRSPQHSNDGFRYPEGLRRVGRTGVEPRV